MSKLTKPDTTESILAALGYTDPLIAARQHAHMILLGKLARYQAHLQQFEAQWNCSLAELRRRYEAQQEEDFAMDDAYLAWQWYHDAAATVTAQLQVLRDASAIQSV